MNKSDLDLDELRTEEAALDQSIALNRITLALLHSQRENNKRLFIALIISILLNAFTVCGFLIYESQWERTDTTTTTWTQSVEGEGNDINNVQGDQYNDQAVNRQGADE